MQKSVIELIVIEMRTKKLKARNKSKALKIGLGVSGIAIVAIVLSLLVIPMTSNALMNTTQANSFITSNWPRNPRDGSFLVVSWDTGMSQIGGHWVDISPFNALNASDHGIVVFARTAIQILTSSAWRNVSLGSGACVVFDNANYTMSTDGMSHDRNFEINQITFKGAAFIAFTMGDEYNATRYGYVQYFGFGPHVMMTSLAGLNLTELAKDGYKISHF